MPLMPSFSSSPASTSGGHEATMEPSSTISKERGAAEKSMSETMSSGSTMISMNLQKKRKKKHQPSAVMAGDTAIVEQLRVEGENDHGDDNDAMNGTDQPPLVIPVQQNTMIRLQDRVAVVKEEDAAAVRALEAGDGVASAAAAAATNGPATIELTSSSASTKLNPADSATTDTDLYRAALEQLPAPLSTSDDAYARVPIDSFGAAVLRGMGWQGEETGGTKDNGSKNDTEPSMPRPHRLGLGAVPKMPDTSNNDTTAGRRPRRMDEYERDQRRAKQYASYEQTIAQQRISDPQRTLQNKSIVYLHPSHGKGGDAQSHRQRARIVQLQGVPGLNRVRVRLEGRDSNNNATIDIPKQHLDGLVSRSDLEQRPFEEPAAPRIKEERIADHDDKSNKKRHRRDERERKSSKKSSKRHKSEPSSSNRTTATWIIPNIRVRIITKRYGKEHYKEKAVVLDVTSGGATLQLGPRTVLDGVLETHVETALPKVGGKCIVVADSSSNRRHHGDTVVAAKYTKGRLLERNSRAAILQESENGAILNVALDDIAEWCGELEDD